MGDGGSVGIAMESNPVPDWLQIAEAVGQAVGTLAVLIALAALWWQFRKDRGDRDAREAQVIEDAKRHDAQIAALRQAEDDRLAAQARWVIPAAYRGNAFSPTLWNLRIDNGSIGAISNLKVTIIIKDANGNVVPHGYRLANVESVGQAMAGFFLPEFSRAIDGLKEKYGELVEYIRTNALSLEQNPEQLAALTEQFNQSVPEMTVTPEMADQIRAQITQAVQMQFTNDWEPILYAGRFQAMAIETTHADYTAHLHVRYEDSNHYLWERTDTDAPRRISE